MSKRQLRAVETVAGDQLEAFGYRRSTRPSAGSRVTTGTVKAWRRTGGRVTGAVAGRFRRGSPPRTGPV